MPAGVGGEGGCSLSCMVGRKRAGVHGGSVEGHVEGEGVIVVRYRARPRGGWMICESFHWFHFDVSGKSGERKRGGGGGFERWRDVG